MKALKIAVIALTSAFVLGSATTTYAQTKGTPTKKVDCPGKSEQSHGKAKQHNPNCRPVR